MSSFEKQVLEQHDDTLQEILGLLQGLEDSPVSQQALDLQTRMRQQRQELEEQLILDKLQGHGPVNQMRRKILDKGRPHFPNLLVNASKSGKLGSESTIVDLLKEFVDKHQTQYEEGGDCMLLGMDVAKHKVDESGFIADEGMHGLLLKFEINGVNRSYLTVNIDQDDGALPDFGLTTLVHAEGEWVEHQHFEVHTEEEYRKAFITFLRKHRHAIPHTCTFSSVEECLKQLQPQTDPEHRSVEVMVDQYRLAFTYWEGNWSSDLSKTYPDDPDINPFGLEVKWLSLTATKQNQLRAAIQSKVNELKAV